jgi:hypothetical protein
VSQAGSNCSLTGSLLQLLVSLSNSIRFTGRGVAHAPRQVDQGLAGTAPSWYRRTSPGTSFHFPRTQDMENPPLVSLSLTHVHYVSHTLMSSHALLILLEPRRPHLVPMRMACPRPPSALRHLRDADMVEPRDRDRPDVCWANGM